MPIVVVRAVLASEVLAVAAVDVAVVAASEAVASVVLVVASEAPEECKLDKNNGKTMLKCFAVVFCFVE